MRLIIFFALLSLMTACDLVVSISPDMPPIIITPEPAVLDTCEELVEITTPPFTLLSTYFFNGAPLMYQWHHKDVQASFISLTDLLEFVHPQYSYTYYEENSAIAVFVEGQTPDNLFQGKIWTYDLVGQRALLTEQGQNLYTWGALTFDEAVIEADKRPSAESFHFNNTNWTPAQNDTYGRKVSHFDLCMEGHYKADYRQAAGISQSIVDSSVLFQWELVLQ